MYLLLKSSIFLLTKAALHADMQHRWLQRDTGDCGLPEAGRKGVVVNVRRVSLQGAADFIVDLEENRMGLDEEYKKHSAFFGFCHVGLQTNRLVVQSIIKSLLHLCKRLPLAQ